MGVLRRTYAWLNARLGLERDLGIAGKAFPAEDSFLLGEVALFCFLMLVLTGMFLGFFYEPSAENVQYEGSVEEYQDEEMPQAYVSVLNITYDVPYGMFIRRFHHWAAHLFVASLGLHMLRVFFTASYQNPREPNWLVGTALAVLSIFAAYTGYALPFDEFAATATEIGYSIANSVPVVGHLLSFIVFGGEFPSRATIPRLYFLHVFLLPLAIAVLTALHLAILVRQKHTEAPRERDLETVGVEGGGRAGEQEAESTPNGDRERLEGRPRRIDREDDSVVVGLPAYPNQTAISAVLFFLTLGVLSLLAGFLPVHNVAEYGPASPASTPELIMPDWFLMWIFGFLKVIPSWASFTIPGTGVHLSTEFIGGVVLPGLVFTAIFVWPFVDSRDEPRQFTADPLARPVNTAIGVTGVVFVMLASIAGMNTIVAALTGLSTDVINPVLLWSMILGPIAAGGITYGVLNRYDASEGSGARTESGGERDE